MATRRKTIPDDVTAADQVAPSASARPTVTRTSKPVLDPLLTANPTPQTAPIIPKRHILSFNDDNADHKPIALTDTSNPTAEESEHGLPELAADPQPEATVQPAVPLTRQADPEAEVAANIEPNNQATRLAPKPNPTEPIAEATTKPPPSDETPSESQSEAAATERPAEPPVKTETKTVKERPNDTERQRRIDQLVAAETYFVPINAVARRRSRITTLLLLLLVLILLIGLVDMLLDTGLLRYDLPHSHFFSDYQMK